jgi:hypothetical protein
MNRTVTALFDTRQEAEAAKARLQSSNIDADRIRVVDKDSSSSSSSSSSSLFVRQQLEQLRRREQGLLRQPQRHVHA